MGRPWARLDPGCAGMCVHESLTASCCARKRWLGRVPTTPGTPEVAASGPASRQLDSVSRGSQTPVFTFALTIGAWRRE